MVCGVLVAAEPAVSRHISVKVTTDNSTDYKEIGGSSQRSKTQKRQLEITLDNRDAEPANDILVEWAIYGRQLTNGKVVKVKEGKESPRVPAMGKMTVKSEQVTIQGTPKHTVTTNRGNRGNRGGHNSISSKSVAATGQEYLGYVVRVRAGSTMIEEVCSHPSLKDEK